MDIRLSAVKVRLPPDDRPLFHIPALEIPHGSKVLIHGPSGKGKTTLLHLMAGLFLPSEGYVYVGEHNLKSLSDEQRCRLRRQHFGMVFQKLNLIDHLTALENVLLTLSAQSGPAAAGEALRQVGLETYASHRTAVLSLGEQQRVAVARVIAARPSILLADEPTSSLDAVNARAVLEALWGVPGNPTMIVVSHDERIRTRFDRVIAFEDWNKV
jgi:ABC-type lipoprotein export system ATPase subunit